MQGLARRALGLLAATGGDGAEAAAALEPALERVAADNEALAEAADGGEVDVPAMAEARAEAVDVAQRAALALLTAVGGRGMELTHPAQRLVREAAFYAIQGQTGEGRGAGLRLSQTQAGSAGGVPPSA